MKVTLVFLISIFLIVGLFIANKKDNKKVSFTPIVGKGNEHEPVLVAAGDIACNEKEKPLVCKQDQTANLIMALRPDIVLTLGDLQYNKGEYNNFNTYYDSSWGRFKENTRPAVGNHEYETKNAQGYFDYFNGVSNVIGIAGERGKGYYSFDVGSWHVVAINSNCWAVGGCQKGSPQGKWLENDLIKDNKRCTLAFWHHPLVSSGQNGQNPTMKSIWSTLYAHNADIVLNGHDHLYERFAPQNPQGIADEKGVRQFTVGTGGRNLYRFETVQANSEARDNENFGVLKLILHNDSYEWEFISIENRVVDKGRDTCV